MARELLELAQLSPIASIGNLGDHSMKIEMLRVGHGTSVEEYASGQQRDVIIVQPLLEQVRENVSTVIAEL